uniref:Uncharacterized protein n=1 Tax=Globisporangium ultimum (strain ATCC 200006 / CBS 805.95 / DAOM BR144) TaxID=431595 RepID=K3X2A0_GLOUD
MLSAAIEAYLEDKIAELPAVLLITYSVLYPLCVVLIVYLRRSRYGVRQGDSSAVNKVLSPASEPLLHILGITTGSYIVHFIISLSIKYYPRTLSSVHLEYYYCGRQFVLLLVIIFIQFQH